MRPPDAFALSSELEQTKRVLASKLAELRTLEQERESLLARVAERDARSRELEARVRELEARVRELEALRGATLDRVRREEIAPLEARVAELESLLARRESRIASLERELEESLDWAAPKGDDLKRVRGIGPKFEQALNALGVRTFAQIAGWSPAEIEAVAARLKIPAGRIEREGWVASAKALAGLT